jgi:hypothetical protein
MRAFLLDPVMRGAEVGHQIPDFLKMAVERAGWDVSRPTAFEPDMDGQKWLSDLRKGIEDADILVCLGSFHALAQSGDDLAALLELIQQKIDGGCPTLLDGCSGLVGEPFSAQKRPILELLHFYGIHLTSTRVSGRIQEYISHSSDMCCGFHKEDGALLDPEIFWNVASVWSAGNRLIDYEPEVFPLIETVGQPHGPHRFSCEMDLPTLGNLGRKNAVAVIRSTESRCLIVSTSSFFGDVLNTLGGVPPGLKDNREFAQNAIDKLTSRVRRPEKLRAKAYELHFELEARLGKMIKVVLARSSRDGDFLTEVPEEIRAKLGYQGGAIDYSKANYVDLVNILNKRWPLFEPLFVDHNGHPMAKNAVIKPLSSLNTQRNYLAHPHKAQQHGREESADDIASLSHALGVVRLASARVQQ